VFSQPYSSVLNHKPSLTKYLTLQLGFREKKATWVKKVKREMKDPR
jgi:hypothetical protein